MEKKVMMVINLTPQLEAAIREQAQRLEVTPEVLVLHTLRRQFLPNALPFEPQDEWERQLFGAAIDCGVSLPNSAVSSEGLYD